MIAMNDRCNCTCGFSVAVEYGFTPCYFEEQHYFDIEIRCSDGSPAAVGKVEGGSAAYFNLPCEGAYSVTVSGPPKFSPRSQTKRVQCRRDFSNGATFIFTELVPPRPHPHPQPPCPPPKPEPCPPKPQPCPPEPCPAPKPQPCPPQPCPPPKPEPCHQERKCRELNIRCSRNGITILE